MHIVFSFSFVSGSKGQVVLSETEQRFDTICVSFSLPYIGNRLCLLWGFIMWTEIMKLSTAFRFSQFPANIFTVEIHDCRGLDLNWCSPWFCPNLTLPVDHAHVSHYKKSCYVKLWRIPVKYTHNETKIIAMSLVILASKYFCGKVS